MAWKRPSLADIIDSISTELLSKPKWAGVDTSQYNTTGQLIRAIATVIDDLYALQEATEHALDPTTATGQPLLAMGTLVGVERKDETRSTIGVQYNGTLGTSIPANTRFRVPDTGQILLANETVTIGASGFVTSTVSAQEYGPEQIPGTTVLEIIDSVSGLTSATTQDSMTFSEGNFAEPFDSVRYRMLANGAASRGGATVEGIQARLQQLDWTDGVIVLCNRGDETDSNGLLPKSVRIILTPLPNATQQKELVNAIWSDGLLPAGIAMNGTYSATITSPWGEEYDIKWDVATDANVQFEVRVDADTIAEDAPSASDREALVKQLIGDYVDSLPALGGSIVASHVEAYLVDNLSWLGNVEVLSLLVGISGLSDNTEIPFDKRVVLDIVSYSEI